MFIMLAGGIWFGFHWQNPPIEWDITTFNTSGGGDYPKEAFRKVNSEIDSKIDSLLGEDASQEHFVAVIPEVSGYRVRLAGSSSSKLFKEPMSRELSDWISERMDQIKCEEQHATP